VPAVPKDHDWDEGGSDTRSKFTGLGDSAVAARNAYGVVQETP
jgi:hypothetical protein